MRFFTLTAIVSLLFTAACGLPHNSEADNVPQITLGLEATFTGEAFLSKKDLTTLLKSEKISFLAFPLYPSGKNLEFMGVLGEDFKTKTFNKLLFLGTAVVHNDSQQEIGRQVLAILANDENSYTGVILLPSAGPAQLYQQTDYIRFSNEGRKAQMMLSFTANNKFLYELAEFENQDFIMENPDRLILDKGNISGNNTFANFLRRAHEQKQITAIDNSKFTNQLMAFPVLQDPFTPGAPISKPSSPDVVSTLIPSNFFNTTFASLLLPTTSDRTIKKIAVLKKGLRSYALLALDPQVDPTNQTEYTLNNQLSPKVKTITLTNDQKNIKALTDN